MCISHCCVLLIHISRVTVRVHMQLLLLLLSLVYLLCISIVSGSCKPVLQLHCSVLLDAQWVRMYVSVLMLQLLWLLLLCCSC